MLRSTQLALHGGRPVRARPFPAHPIIGRREKQAVLAVLSRGMLSGFHADFLGGPQIRRFEREAAEYFRVRHAIAVNSGTAALHTALADHADTGGRSICYHGDKAGTRSQTIVAVSAAGWRHNRLWYAEGYACTANLFEYSDRFR